MGTRIAVDIGGTFTDLVVESESGTEVSKVLSTPEDLVEGVLTRSSRRVLTSPMWTFSFTERP